MVPVTMGFIRCRSANFSLNAFFFIPRPVAKNKQPRHVWRKLTALLIYERWFTIVSLITLLLLKRSGYIWEVTF